MQKMSLIQNNKAQVGSFTLEAALVFTIIFMSILCILNAGIYLYARGIVQSISDNATKIGVSLYKNINSNIDSGKVYKKDLSEGTYWRIYRDKKEVNQKISEYVENRIEKCKLNSFINTQVEVNTYNSGFYKELEVKVECLYILGIFNIFKPFKVISKTRIESIGELLVNNDLNVDLNDKLFGELND